MKLGIVTPVLHMNPRFTPPKWEEDGSFTDVVDVVRHAESLGMNWISCSEHVAIPQDASTVRGGRYWDPFSTLGALSQHTKSIGLLSHMIVLPYHHPLEIVKRMGTLDLLSQGRVILGVGVGSLTKEFVLLGHQFDGRGPKADDAIRAIQASWGKRVPTYQGSHYSFEGMIVEPSGLEREVPIWVGGKSMRSLKRAIALGHAWMPFRLTLDDLHATLENPVVRELLAKRQDEHRAPLDFIFAPEPLIDPVGEPSKTASFLASYRDVGATGLSLRFHHTSKAHYMEQLDATCAIVTALSQ